MRGVKLRETVFDVHQDLIGIFESGMGARCIFRARVVDEAERHINIVFGRDRKFDG